MNRDKFFPPSSSRKVVKLIIAIVWAIFFGRINWTWGQAVPNGFEYLLLSFWELLLQVQRIIILTGYSLIKFKKKIRKIRKIVPGGRLVKGGQRGRSNWKESHRMGLVDGCRGPRKVEASMHPVCSLEIGLAKQFALLTRSVSDAFCVN